MKFVKLTRGQQAGCLLAWAALCIAAASATNRVHAAGGGEARGSDLKFFEGNWSFVKLNIDGSEVPPDDLENIKLTFKANKMSLSIMGFEKSGTITIDSSKTPKHITLEFDGGEIDPGFGIFEVVKDNVKIYAGKTKETRPKDFASDAAVMIVLKRAPADKDEKKDDKVDKKDDKVDKKGDNRRSSPEALPLTGRGSQSKTDRELIQGTWQPTTIRLGNQKLPDEAKQLLEEMRIVVTDGKISFTVFDLEMEGTFKLDPSHKPKQIDLEMNDTKVEGIYELKGDKIRICGAEPGKGRPKSFADESNIVLEMQRVPEKMETVAVPEPAAAQGGRKKDVELIQGKWSVESIIDDGMEMDPTLVKGIHFTVTGDKLNISVGDTETFHGTYKADESTTPKNIDVVVADGPTLTGIYELKDDTVKFCLVEVNADKSTKRPTEFKSTAGSGLKLVVLKRAKDEKKGGAKEPRQRSEVVAFVDEQDKGVKTGDDKELLQGTWQATSAVEGGMSLPKELVDGLQLVVKGDTMTLLAGGKGEDAAYKIDSTTTPKQMDVKPGSHNTQEGIYEVTKDSLKICSHEAGSGNRPKEFKAEKDSTYLLLEFKRVDRKKEDKKGDAKEPRQRSQPVAFLDGQDKGGKTDQESLQGTWQVVKMTAGGNRLQDFESKMQLVIKGDGLSVMMDGKGRDNNFKLDATKKPKHIDLVTAENKDRKVEGIYELNGDTLKICTNERGARPTEFKSEGGTDLMVMELKRVPDKKEEKNSDPKKLAGKNVPATDKSDVDRIMGIWKLLQARGDGEDGRPEMIEAVRMTFDIDGTVNVEGTSKTDKRTYQVDAAANPKQITLTIPEKKETIAGIYKFDGNKLVLCFREGDGGGKERPKEFKADKGTKQVLFVLEQTKTGMELTRERTEGNEDADRLRSMRNLNQIAMAMMVYHDVHKKFPAHAIYSKDGRRPLLSWRVAILPYLDEPVFYKEFKIDEPWDSEHNKKLISKMPKIYEPLGRGRKGVGLTYFQVFTGKGTVFDGNMGMSLLQIKDGASNTILAVEGRNPVIWTKPDDLVLPENPNASLPELGGQFTNGFIVVMCDRHTFSVDKDYDRTILRALITPNGSEPNHDLELLQGHGREKTKKKTTDK